MKCKDAFLLLSQRRDEDLPLLDEQLLQQHLATCPGCSAAQKQLESQATAVRHVLRRRLTAPSAATLGPVVRNRRESLLVLLWPAVRGAVTIGTLLGVLAGLGVEMRFNLHVESVSSMNGLGVDVLPFMQRFGTISQWDHVHARVLLVLALVVLSQAGFGPAWRDMRFQLRFSAAHIARLGLTVALCLLAMGAGLAVDRLYYVEPNHLGSVLRFVQLMKLGLELICLATLGGVLVQRGWRQKLVLTGVVAVVLGLTVWAGFIDRPEIPAQETGQADVRLVAHGANDVEAYSYVGDRLYEVENLLLPWDWLADSVALAAVLGAFVGCLLGGMSYRDATVSWRARAVPAGLALAVLATGWAALSTTPLYALLAEYSQPPRANAMPGRLPPLQRRVALLDRIRPPLLRYPVPGLLQELLQDPLLQQRAARVPSSSWLVRNSLLASKASLDWNEAELLRLAIERSEGLKGIDTHISDFVQSLGPQLDGGGNWHEGPRRETLDPLQPAMFRAQYRAVYEALRRQRKVITPFDHMHAVKTPTVEVHGRLVIDGRPADHVAVNMLQNFGTLQREDVELQEYEAQVARGYGDEDDSSYYQEDTFLPLYKDELQQSAITDAEGRFRVAWVPQGNYILAVLLPGQPSAVLADRDLGIISVGLNPARLSRRVKRTVLGRGPLCDLGTVHLLVK